MASRRTREEAEKVKAETEARHPGADIRIVEKVGSACSSRARAEAEGLEIVADDGGPYVAVKDICYLILEARKCRGCGAEVLSAAIGEDSFDECPACREKRKSRQARESAERIERKAHERRESERFDEFWK